MTEQKTDGAKMPGSPHPVVPSMIIPLTGAPTDAAITQSTLITSTTLDPTKPRVILPSVGVSKLLLLCGNIYADFIPNALQSADAKVGGSKLSGVEKRASVHSRVQRRQFSQVIVFLCSRSILLLCAGSIRFWCCQVCAD
jgi:hypothetical protein